MAIYHLRIAPVKKAGATAVSAHHTGTKMRSRGALGRAAYLSGQRLRSDLDGKAIDYRSKEEGVEHSRLFLPHGVSMDRETFWNAVDNHPVRRDAKSPTVARDIIVALPHELTADERRAAVEELCGWIADHYGTGVDLGMHVHTDAELAAGSDARNYHAHILISERRVMPDGTLGTLNRDLNATDCRKNGRPTMAETVRQRWQDTANAALARGGHRERIDCRSYAARGIDLTPGEHLGRLRMEEQRRRRARTPQKRHERTRKRAPGDPALSPGMGRVMQWIDDPLKAFENDFKARGRTASLSTKIAAARQRQADWEYWQKARQRRIERRKAR